MREIFEKQLEDSKVVTEEQLPKMKTYHNGVEIKVGDRVLCAFMVTENHVGELELRLIFLNENQFDLFELDESRGIKSKLIPTIKYK